MNSCTRIFNSFLGAIPTFDRTSKKLTLWKHSEWLFYSLCKKVRNRPEDWQETSSLGFLWKPLIIDLLSWRTATIHGLRRGPRLVSRCCQGRREPVKQEDVGPLCAGCHLSSVLKDEQDFFIGYAYIKLGLCIHHC